MSDVDDRLLRRLDELQRRVNELESRRRVSPRWVVVLVCGFLGGWLGRFLTDLPRADAQPNANRDLEVRSLRIVDDQRKTFLHIDSDKFNGFARFFNAQGKVVVAIGSDADGGSIQVNGQNGGERAYLGVGERNGGGLLHFHSADSKTVPMSLGVGPRGGYLALYNLSANQRSLWLGSRDEDSSGVISIYDSLGKSRCEFGSNPQGGTISLHGNKNKPNVFLGTGNKEFGGLFLLRDDNAKVRAEIGQDANGGYLMLNGKSDLPAVSFANSDDQRGGFLQIRNNAGKPRVELGINDGGAGYIDTFEKK